MLMPGSDSALGVKLKVKGNKQGDVLWVTEAEFED